MLGRERRPKTRLPCRIRGIVAGGDTVCVSMGGGGVYARGRRGLYAGPVKVQVGSCQCWLTPRCGSARNCRYYGASRQKTLRLAMATGAANVMELRRQTLGCGFAYREECSSRLR